MLNNQPQTSWQNQFITPSRIDMFYAYMHNTYEWEIFDYHGEEWSIDLFVRKILKLEKTHYAASAGTALHKILEEARYNQNMDTASANGWDFKFLIDNEIYLPPIKELAVTGYIGSHFIKGTCDVVDAFAIHDIKTTKDFDYEKYFTSWQWRFYLLLAERKQFFYDVFLTKFNVKADKTLADQCVSIIGFEQIPLHEYGTMRRDCEEIVDWFYKVLTDSEELIRVTALANNVEVIGLTH